MEITTSEEMGRVPVTVFRLTGPIIESEQLETQAKEAFELGARNIVIDLTDVPYMASPGLRALHFIYNLLRSGDSDEGNADVSKGIAAGTYKSANLKLVGPSRDVLEILRATGYDMFLDVYKNTREAVASY